LVSLKSVRGLARKLGFMPMLFWGKWFTTIPYDKKVTIVLGDPILVPRIAEPSKEESEKYLGLFINEMEALFYKYREEAGYPDLRLEIL
jgi:2-acylglycerol O-acyltransferase 2